MASKKIRGFFIHYKDQYYGPVDTKPKAEELCVYLLNKNQKLVIKGDNPLEIIGKAPVVCKGNIRIDDANQKVVRQDFRPLYTFDIRINEKEIKKQLMNKFISEQEKLNEQKNEGTSTT